MHSACLAICKMNKLHKIIGQNIEHEQVIECFHQPLIMELHCTGMILCRPFWNSFLQMILQLFVLEGFQFSIHQQIISYSCNYFFQWVKCMRLKKSDLFRIFWAKPLKAPFPSDLLHFFQFGSLVHFFGGEKQGKMWQNHLSRIVRKATERKTIFWGVLGYVIVTISISISISSKSSSIESEWMSQGMQMEGSGNAVTEQFLAAICLSSQRTPVQQDTQVKSIAHIHHS